MRLIFIRHGDPDYAHDTITRKGEQDVLALRRRVAKWLDTSDTFDFYTSPLRRSLRTAEIALRGSGKEAQVLPWLKEFYHLVKDPVTGGKHSLWDWMPAWFADKKQSALHDALKWTAYSAYKQADEDEHGGCTPVADYYAEVCNGLDAVLSRYGYTPDGTLPGIYRTDGTHSQGYRLNKSTDTYKDWHDGRTAVFFCHLGVMFASISHLIAVSPVVLWQSFFVAPASLTILSSEEREPGIAAFRVQSLGDTAHLQAIGEKPSSSGYFTDTFAL